MKATSFFKSQLWIVILSWMVTNVIIGGLLFWYQHDEFKQEILNFPNAPYLTEPLFNSVIFFYFPLALAFGIVFVWIIYYAQPWFLKHSKITILQNEPDSWSHILWLAAIVLVVALCCWLALTWFNIKHYDPEYPWFACLRAQFRYTWLTGQYYGIVLAPLLLLSGWKFMVLCVQHLMPSLAYEYSERIREVQGRLHQLAVEELKHKNKVDSFEEKSKANEAKLRNDRLALDQQWKKLETEKQKLVNFKQRLHHRGIVICNKITELKAYAVELDQRQLDMDKEYQAKVVDLMQVKVGVNKEDIQQERECLMEQAQKEAQDIKDQAQAETDDLERRRQEIRAWEAELAEGQAALEQSRLEVGRYRVQTEQEIQAARDQAREIIEQAQKEAQGIKEEIQAQEDKLKRNLDQLKDFFVWANFRAQDKHISKEFWQEVIEAREAVFAEAQKKAVELMVQGEVSDESIKKRILENQALAISDYKLLTEEDLAMIKVLVRPEIDRIIAQARAEVVKEEKSAAVTVQAPAVPADAGDTGPGRAGDTGNQEQDAEIPQVEGVVQESQEIKAADAKVIRLFHSQQVAPQEVVPEGSDEQENPPSMVDEARETLASDEQQRDQSDPGSISDHDKQDQNILGQETNVATPKKEIEYQEQTVGSQEECNEELEPCDDQQQWEAFLSACKEIFGDRAFLTQDLLDAMENHDVLKDILPNSLKAKSLKGFGKVLGNQVGRRYGDRGLYLVRVAKIGPNKDLKGWQIGHKDNQL